MVALLPGFKVVLLQVLVGQSQCAETVAGVLLFGRERQQSLPEAEERMKASLTFRCEVVMSLSF